MTCYFSVTFDMPVKEHDWKMLLNVD